MDNFFYDWLPTGPQETKKADVLEYSEAFQHVGLLVNEPTGTASLLFNQSSGELESIMRDTPCQSGTTFPAFSMIPHS